MHYLYDLPLCRRIIVSVGENPSQLLWKAWFEKPSLDPKECVQLATIAHAAKKSITYIAWKKAMNLRTR